MTESYRTRSGGKKLEFLKQIYVGGIICTFLVAMVAGLLHSTILTRLAFVAGLLHLLLLVWLGFGLSKAQDDERSYRLTQAGSRIQNAGYLHTLIGFASAIASLNSSDGNFDISYLSVPLSTALITSLIGWLAGGEVSALGETESPDLERATRGVVQSLEKYSEDISRIQTKYTARLVEDYKKYVDSLSLERRRLSGNLENDFKQHGEGMAALRRQHTKKLEAEHSNHIKSTLSFYE
ncbi:MAG: hypothetical protein AAFY72_11285, partial [Cyanobacteria bacterium J06649_4]